MILMEKKIQLIEEYLKTGEKIDGKTTFKGYPIGKWSIRIRFVVNNALKNGTEIPRSIEQQLKKLKQLGILNRINSAVDEKVQLLIKWRKDYPKITLIPKASDNVIKQYAKTPEEFENLKEQYQEVLDAYNNLRIRKSKNQLGDRIVEICENEEIGGVFINATEKSKRKQIAKKYKLGRGEVDRIINNYKSIENLYDLYINNKIQDDEDIKTANKIIKNIIDIDGDESSKAYEKLYRKIFNILETNNELILYSSSELKRMIQVISKSKEKAVLEKSFGLIEGTKPKTLMQVAQEMELSDTRIGQIKDFALERLQIKSKYNTQSLNFDMNYLKNSKNITDDEKLKLLEIEKTIKEVRLGNISYQDKKFHMDMNTLKIINKRVKERAKEEKKYISLEMLNLPESTYNLLKNAGINSLKDLSDSSRDELFKLKEFQKEDYHNVIRTLQKHELLIKEKKEQNIIELKQDEDILIIHAGFSSRALNCLLRQGIKTLRELANYTEEDIKSIKRLGIGSYNEIIEILGKYGVTLKQMPEKPKEIKENKQTPKKSSDKAKIPDKTIEKYPELILLMNSTASKSENKFKDYNTTIASIKLLKYVVTGDYEKFTKCQETKKLSKENFKEINKYTMKKIKSAKDLENIITYIIMDKLGRVPDLSPSFLKLDNEYQSIVLDGINTQFNIEQFIQDKNSSQNIEKVTNLNEESFNQYMLQKLYNFAGKDGDATRQGTNVINDDSWKKFKEAEKTLQLLRQEKCKKNIKNNEEFDGELR